MSQIPERLKRLREAMRQEGLQAYMIPSTDAHQSEYVPECWQRRTWISGFTGSAGDVVVTQDNAGLWTDSRYYLEAGGQLEGSGIVLFKSGLPGVLKAEDWLSKELAAGSRVGIDPRVVDLKASEAMEAALTKHGLKLQFLEENLIDRIWEDQPEPAAAPITVLEERHAGEPVESKLARIREKMGEAGASVHVIAAMDSIAWLLNLRGSDVDYNPVFIAYAAIAKESATLFVNPEKANAEVRDQLAGLVDIRPYEDLKPYLQGRASEGDTIWLDESATNRWVADLVGDHALRVERSPVSTFKAKKNPTELAGMRRAHQIDGVAVVRFLKWLDETISQDEPVSELTAAQKLESFRQEGEGYVGQSFPTISGYGPHGSIIHYRVDESSDIPIGKDNLYLVDSGGQYLFGTTDITRTLCFGSPTPEQKDAYSRVLRGHIELTTLCFPKGVTGKHIDVLARRSLWDAGLNFLHGTGHGIGHYLNVHEGPISISSRAPEVALSEGHILSNEPGCYSDGQFGIRTENLIVVVADEVKSSDRQKFLKFETLTRCPIDTGMIDTKTLGDHAVEWLNAYHATVREDLTPLLAPEDASWLHSRTEPI